MNTGKAAFSKKFIESILRIWLRSYDEASQALYPPLSHISLLYTEVQSLSIFKKTEAPELHLFSFLIPRSDLLEIHINEGLIDVKLVQG